MSWLIKMKDALFNRDSDEGEDFRKSIGSVSPGELVIVNLASSRKLHIIKGLIQCDCGGYGCPSLLSSGESYVNDSDETQKIKLSVMSRSGRYEIV